MGETPGAAGICRLCGSTADLWRILQIGPAYVTWACTPHAGEAMADMADRPEPEFKVTRAIGEMAKALGFDSTKADHE